MIGQLLLHRIMSYRWSRVGKRVVFRLSPPLKSGFKTRTGRLVQTSEEAAFAIAYVMKRDGIKVPNKFNGGGVVSDIINPERVKRLTLDINKIIKAKILTILTQ